MDSRTFVKCVAELSGVDKEIAERVRDLRRLALDGQIETSCPDSGDSRSRCAGSGPTTSGLVFHCLVPAARWWDDIVFT